MTKTLIENISDGPRGYWHNGSLKVMANGEAREMEADEADAALANPDYFAKAKVSAKAKDPLDHDNNGKKGGSAPAAGDKAKA